MFFEPLTTWIAVLASNGALLAKEKLGGLDIKEEKNEKEKFPEPHRDPKTGKIIVENCSLFNKDCEDYGTAQAYKWVKQGKYNLTTDELEKENRRIEEKCLRTYELAGCLSEKDKKRLEELRQAKNGNLTQKEQAERNQAQKELIRERLEKKRAERANKEAELLE